MSTVRIFVVEDEGIEAMDIKRTLESFGYNVPCVMSSGEEVIKKAIEHKPDLILMDIALKGEITGIEVASDIKELDIPVIYLTSLSDESTVKKALLTEPYAYLLKPFDVIELRFTVELALFKHETNKKLRESEKSYRTLSENLPGIVYRVFLRRNWEMHFFNDMVMEMTGYLPEELKHGEVCSIDPLIIPKDREYVVKTVENSIESRESFEVEYRIKHKNGSVRYFQERGQPVYGDDGKPLYIDGVILDITKTHYYKLELEKSYKSLKTTFNAIGECMCFVDADGTLKQCNLAMESFLGKSSQEFLGKKCWEVVHGVSEPVEDCPVVRMWKSRKRESLEIPIDDKWYSLIADPIFDESGELTGAVHIIADITQRKRTLRDLQASILEKEITSQVAMKLVGVTSTREIYMVTGNAIKELLPDSYVIVSGISPDEKNVRIMEILGPNHFLNKLTTILGIDPYKMEFTVEDISIEDLKKHRSEVLTEYKGGLYDLTLKKIPKPICRMIEKIFHVVEVYSIRFSFEGRHFGGVSIALLKNQPIEHKEVIETIVHQASIAIRRSRAEEAIKESLKEKEVLLREIHHRVKNNMQIVSSLLNLQTQYVEGEETQNVLKESQNRVKSMAMLHEKLYQSTDLIHIKFDDYIKRLVSDLFYSYDVHEQIKPVIDVVDVKLNIETALPCGLIISELVSNSLKHAFPSGGKGEVQVLLQADDHGYILTVSDNGVGLPENLDYKNAKSLGLQLVYNLVKQLDGEIEMDRSHGAKFIIKFNELEYKERI